MYFGELYPPNSFKINFARNLVMMDVLIKIVHKFSNILRSIDSAGGVIPNEPKLNNAPLTFRVIVLHSVSSFQSSAVSVEFTF